jgi:hypothetical protein
VPIRVPIVRPISSGANRRVSAMVPSPCAAWITLLSRTGTMSMPTAIFTSTTCIISGSATIGRPMLTTPFTSPPASRAAAQTSIVGRAEVSSVMEG